MEDSLGVLTSAFCKAPIDVGRAHWLTVCITVLFFFLALGESSADVLGAQGVGHEQLVVDSGLIENVDAVLINLVGVLVADCEL